MSTKKPTKKDIAIGNIMSVIAEHFEVDMSSLEDLETQIQTILSPPRITDPEKPKKPKTYEALFIEYMKQKDSNMMETLTKQTNKKKPSAKDVSEYCKNVWDELPEAKKLKFFKLAEQAKQEYKQAMEEYIAPSEERMAELRAEKLAKQRKKKPVSKTDDGEEKKPKNSWHLYTADMQHDPEVQAKLQHKFDREQKKEKPNYKPGGKMTIDFLTKAYSIMWSKLKEEDPEKVAEYVARAEKLKKEYEERHPPKPKKGSKPNKYAGLSLDTDDEDDFDTVKDTAKDTKKSIAFDDDDDDDIFLTEPPKKSNSKSKPSTPQSEKKTDMTVSPLDLTPIEKQPSEKPSKSKKAKDDDIEIDISPVSSPVQQKTTKRTKDISPVSSPVQQKTTKRTKEIDSSPDSSPVQQKRTKDISPVSSPVQQKTKEKSSKTKKSKEIVVDITEDFDIEPPKITKKADKPKLTKQSSYDDITEESEPVVVKSRRR